MSNKTNATITGCLAAASFVGLCISAVFADWENVGKFAHNTALYGYISLIFSKMKP